MKQVLMVIAACSAMLAGLDVDAKRLGGGRSFGAPRDAATQRQMTPPAQNMAPAPMATPAPASAAAKGPLNTPPAAAQPAWKRWIGPVAGIAAGLGIAALMSHLGLSEGFGNILMMLLLVIAVVVVFRLIFRRRTPAGDANQGLQYAGAAAGSGGAPMMPGTGSGLAGAAATAGTMGTLGTVGTVGAIVAQPTYPAGFEPEPFLQQGKINFARLQIAYDQGDSAMLRDVMTPEMFAEVTRDLAARGTHQPTDIVRLDAEILEVVSDNDYHWATVRFHGLTREDGVETPQPFDEAWNLRKAVDGSTGWLLAGIQQRQ